MAITEQSLMVAQCDSPSCRVQHFGKDEKSIEGIHVTMLVVDESGDGHELHVYAHAPSHVGSATRAALRKHAETVEGDGLEGPQVPVRPSGNAADDLLADDET